jgi:hypothetical protein
MNKTISSDNCRYSDIDENQDQSQGVDAITTLIPEEDGAIMDNYSKDGHRVRTTSLNMSRKEIKSDKRRKEKLYRSDERLNRYNMNENRINKTTTVDNNVLRVLHSVRSVYLCPPPIHVLMTGLFQIFVHHLYYHLICSFDFHC